MPNTSHFIHIHGLKNCTIALILQHLHFLKGLVYLNDNGQAIIGFAPDFYIQAQNRAYQMFSKTAWNLYTCNQNVTESLHTHIQFTSDATELHATPLTHTDPIHSQMQTGFQGGYIGFVGYDFAAAQQIEVGFATQPACYLGYYPHFLKQVNAEWYFCSNSTDARTVWAELELLLQPLLQPLMDASPTLQYRNLQLKSPLQPRWQRGQYVAALQRVQDYIRAGDCYQINLTQEFKGRATGSLLGCADALWKLTQAPYAGYLRVDDFELISCSPELFLEFSETRQLKTRPIKGTRPRADCPTADAASKQELLASVKDQAENVMIVDLLRNDLSVYAETGSVKTPKLFEIESFKQVHHLVSEVVATLKPNSHPLEVLLSALPGGSITGAPKKRAMQIIAELEQAPRGAYCGSLGYFNVDGTGCWNILIRTVQKMQDDVSVWAGGGITIASDADAEYQECFDKIAAMVDLLNTWAYE